MGIESLAATLSSNLPVLRARLVNEQTNWRLNCFCDVTAFFRRDMLQFTAAALGASFSGCTSVLGNSGVQLERIRVVNLRAEPHTVHLLAELDDEITYWSSHRLAPTNTGSDGVSEADADVIEDEWPDEADTITIHAKLDDGPSWSSIALHENGDGCYIVDVLVERTEQPPTEVSLLYSTDCDH